jgi:hypothetical protein
LFRLFALLGGQQGMDLVPHPGMGDDHFGADFSLAGRQRTHRGFIKGLLLCDDAQLFATLSQLLFQRRDLILLGGPDGLDLLALFGSQIQGLGHAVEVPPFSHFKRFRTVSSLFDGEVGTGKRVGGYSVQSAADNGYSQECCDEDGIFHDFSPLLG